MEKWILFSLFIFSVFIFARAFSFFAIHYSMYFQRDKMCIERIVKQQKASDFLNASYQLFISIIGLILIIACVMIMFNANCIKLFKLSSISLILLCYIIFFIIKYKIESMYDLHNCYVEMIDYRSKQEVVTQDNDNEVSFIKSYEKILKHKKIINIWVILALCILIWV